MQEVAARMAVSIPATRAQKHCVSTQLMLLPALVCGLDMRYGYVQMVMLRILESVQCSAEKGAGPCSSTKMHCNKHSAEGMHWVSPHLITMVSNKGVINFQCSLSQHQHCLGEQQDRSCRAHAFAHLDRHLSKLMS